MEINSNFEEKHAAPVVTFGETAGGCQEIGVFLWKSILLIHWVQPEQPQDANIECVFSGDFYMDSIPW